MTNTINCNNLEYSYLLWILHKILCQIWTEQYVGPMQFSLSHLSLLPWPAFEDDSLVWVKMEKSSQKSTGETLLLHTLPLVHNNVSWRIDS